MMPFAMTARALTLALAGMLAAPAVTGAQVFFAETPSPALRIAPLSVRATVTSAEGPVRVRLRFSVVAPPGVKVPDLYLLWPGDVKGDPALGDRDAALAQHATGLRFEVIDEGRLPYRARRVDGAAAAAAREIVPGGAPYVTFVQTGGELGLSAPATWIRIPASPRLADPDWIMTLELPSLSVVKRKPTTFLERWLLGERRIFSMTFNEVRGRPLFRMYLAHRDRVVRLGDAPAEMTVSLSEADHLKIDSVTPAGAVRGISETAESTETVSVYLDADEGMTPQRLSVQYAYFSRGQAAAVVAVPLILLALGYAVGPLIGRASLHIAQRLAGRFHVGRWDGVPRERRAGVLLSPDVLARIRPGETTHDEVLRLCGGDVEVAEHFPADGRKTLFYRGRRIRPQTRRLVGFLSAVRHLEVERHEVAIELAGDVVQDVKADIRRSRAPVGEPTGGAGS
jgi:hypothetical protein